MKKDLISEAVLQNEEFLLTPHTKRAYRDSLFRSIYSGNDERSKRWVLSLYNALTGKNHTDTSELEITTIEDVLYVSIKNDLSFLIDSQMCLFEHQSTVNPNMPLRGLLYFAQLYQKEIAKRKMDVFRSTLIKLPAPKFIVFYNGSVEQADVIKYKLSDAFIKEDDLQDSEHYKEKNLLDSSCNDKDAVEFEWTATVININKNHNESIQKNCESLYHYCEFVDRVKASIEQGMEPKDAINEAVDFAIKGNFLDGYFKEQKMSIIANLLTDFNQEDYDRNRREEGYEIGIQDGIAKGIRENAIANAKNFLQETDLPPEKIARCCSLPLEQVLALKEELAREPATAK